METRIKNDADALGNGALSPDRRRFLKIMGGGILVCFMPVFPDRVQEALAADHHGLPKGFNAFLRIAEDNRVTCFSGKIEMGQGIITSLAQMLAEELDVPLSSVDMVMGDTERCPWDAGTFGSMSTKYFGADLREAAAEARAVLIELTAERLQLPVERLETNSAFVYDKQAPHKKISYGELTRGKTIERYLDKIPSLKPRETFTISGKAVGRTDASEKVTGKARYAGDISLPDMLYARIVRPPAHGAKRIEVDTSAAEKIPGARIIRDGGLIAVAHSLPDEAERALTLIKAKFRRPQTNLNDTNIFDHLLAVAPPGTVVAEKGDLHRGRNLSSRVIEAIYRHGYVAHAPVETHTAVANVAKGKATVWASTQRPFGAREEVAEALGLPLQRVRIITPQVGGGFGGKTHNRQVVEAARLAKRTGRPVQVAWTRAEEFFYDNFLPAAVVKVASGLDRSKRVIFWDYHVFFAGGDRAPSFYDVPHKKTTAYGSWRGGPGFHPFGVGPWRAPDSNTNTFARESHVDTLAAAAGMDPLSFRLVHLQDKRMIRVLEAVAKGFGWSSAAAPGQRGRGLACGIFKGTYVAAMGEVEVDQANGHCRVKRVVCAQDMGQVVNPEGARLQIEGCVMMGLGYALAEKIRFQDGEILDLNFDTYEIPKFSWLPKIETILIDNPDMPPQEGGEPAVTCMGGLVANAIFDATGVRFHELPISPERIREALKTQT
jgi:nicotinate dehydrogenase subunit B